MKLLHRITFILCLLAFCNYSFGQTYNGLQSLGHQGISLFYSKGQKQRATDIAALVQKAVDFNSQLLDFKPEVTVLVLNAEDWSKHTTFPVYGMPHYKGDKTLIVASTDNDFWRSFTPPIDGLPAPLAKEVRKAYGTANGELSMQPFFDLLAIHELGHAFHIQGGLTMQRRWMGELFCNILLHTYIAENEPSFLDALTLFPEMVVTAGTAGYKFTSLNEFESNYTELGMQHPKNYGWYQSRLHVAAKQIYDAGGKKVLVKLWDALRSTSNKMNDEQFASLMNLKVHPAVGDVMVNW